MEMNARAKRAKASDPIEDFILCFHLMGNNTLDLRSITIDNNNDNHERAEEGQVSA